jgi:hypothetical protein
MADILNATLVSNFPAGFGDPAANGVHFHEFQVKGLFSAAPRPDHYSLEGAQAVLKSNQGHRFRNESAITGVEEDRKDIDDSPEVPTKSSKRIAVALLNRSKSKIKKLRLDNGEDQQSAPRMTTSLRKGRYANLAGVESSPLPDYTHTQLLILTQNAAVTEFRICINRQDIAFSSPENDLSIPKDDQDRRKYRQSLLGAMEDTSQARDSSSAAF